MLLPRLWEFLALFKVLSYNFVFLAALFYPLEVLFPARRQNYFRRGWTTDCLFYIVHHTVFEGLPFMMFSPLLIMSVNAGLAPLQSFVHREPQFLQAVEVILLGDFLSYWYHRLMHASKWLWPFHSIHHSPEEMDWLTTHREHPVDLMLGSMCITIPALLFGFSMSTVSWLFLFRGFWSLYLHSNTRLPFGPLRIIIGCPELHRWHHSKEHFQCNYSNFSPWMDVLFRTYHGVPEEPVSLGLPQPIPENFWLQLIHPVKAISQMLWVKKTSRESMPELPSRYVGGVG